jgi:hypothetical protein
VAIGAKYNDGTGSSAGHVRVFQRDGSSAGPYAGWTQVGGDIDGEAAYDESGYSVSLSADGSVVAIGAYRNDGATGSNAGHVRVYKLPGVACKCLYGATPQWDGDACVASACAPGYTWTQDSLTSGTCTACLDPAAPGVVLNACAACPGASPQWNGDACVVSECAADHTWTQTSLTSGTCTACTAATPKVVLNACAACPDATPQWNGAACVACPAATPKWDGAACVGCPGAELIMSDSYGDGWNGGTITIGGWQSGGGGRITETQMTLSSGSIGTETYCDISYVKPPASPGSYTSERSFTIERGGEVVFEVERTGATTWWGDTTRHDCVGAPFVKINGTCPTEDCAGVVNGTNKTCCDCAGVCHKVPPSDYVAKTEDQCGVCGGDDSTCEDCAGVPNGDVMLDACGVCGGDDSACKDCAGVPNGDATLDACGMCGGDHSSCNCTSLRNAYDSRECCPGTADDACKAISAAHTDKECCA